LTPPQANKMTLAEHLGEISLSPRHPDDDSPADTTEYSATDLLNGTEEGSREKEQDRDGTEKDSDGGLLNAIRENLPPAKPPFVMEIVEAEEVREELFDPDTGKPIHDRQAKSKPAKPSYAPQPNTAAPAGAMTGEQSDGTSDSFPIKFE
jgi:pilus assembly protein CpaB